MNTQQQMIESVEEYIRALKAFDWYHEYSDDFRVYQQGRERYYTLRQAQRSYDPEGTIWAQYERR